MIRRTHIIAACLFGLAILSDLGAQQKEPVQVFHEENSDGSYTVFVSTVVPAPIQILVSFPVLQNVVADGPLPLDYIVVSQAKRARMVTFRRLPGPMSFRYETQWWVGDPENAHADPNTEYAMPFGPNTIAPIVQGYHGSFTHMNDYALDFAMPEGTPIMAAREGVVVMTKDDSQVSGADPSFTQSANYIMIFHDDGTFAEYAHLKFRGVLVHSGHRVQKGEIIGYSGNTGYTRGPHLHFSVHVPTYHGSKTIATKFRDSLGRLIEPK